MTQEDLEAQLIIIEKLPDNWDWHGGYPIFNTIINEVRNLLSSLDSRILRLLDTGCLTPMPNGTLAVEFERGGKKLFVEFGLNTYSYFTEGLSGEASDNCPHKEVEQLHLLANKIYQ